MARNIEQGNQGQPDGKQKPQGILERDFSRREVIVGSGKLLAAAFLAGGLGKLLTACGKLAEETTTTATSSAVTAPDKGNPKPNLKGETSSTTTSSTPETTSTTNPEHLEPIRIASKEEAAKRFGADEYSSNPDNWEINEWGGAHLKDNPTDAIVRVKTAGAVVEGWIKPKKKLNSDFDAVTIVAHPSVEILEIQGGTFWDFGLTNQDQGFAQVLQQVREKEPIEQPGVVVLPLCDKLGSDANLGLSVNPIKSKKEAAERFGADEYSSNPDNWEINEWGGAHLKDNPTDEIVRIKTAGAVAEGWIKPKKKLNSEYDAVTIVVHPNVEEFEAQGATLWDFGANQDNGFRQVLGQVQEKEPKEQPGVVVLPVHSCPLKK